jgi:molybdopterin molybdotransferase
MAEVCSERDGGVEVAEAVSPGKNVGAVGEDIRAGALVLEAGRRLRPQDAGLLASIGLARPLCVRRPRVQLVVTGDELLPAGQRPGGVRIVDSNSVMLRALVARDGGELLPYEILPDRPEVIREALTTQRADLILVSGGSSVGNEDHAPRLVAELGSLDFHGISMRPSSPTGIGRIGKGAKRPRSEAEPSEGGPPQDWTFVFLLPGNPVSCLCAYEFFAGPMLRGLGGRSRAWPHRRVRLPLARKIASAIGRTDYVRVALEAGRVVPVSTSGASILSSTVRAAGCVIVPRGLEGMPEGAEVEVLLYDEEGGP